MGFSITILSIKISTYIPTVLFHFLQSHNNRPFHTSFFFYTSHPRVSSRDHRYNELSSFLSRLIDVKSAE